MFPGEYFVVGVSVSPCGRDVTDSQQGKSMRANRNQIMGEF